ncbi:NADP-dependent malic enzyme [Acinetobacter nosocomialis]|jgi:malate dehydrogenase (oxaloacetate-decarboxylating)(NADP+)|uniref:NADP-dependent malic enzyme n=3 Tax=Acinetobacter nosocomialis TaxID=106654 RepID=A0A1Y3GIX0_ACINO|nr:MULTISPECIES: NADP-dependent malic enzyme [Acinetobacter]KCX93176.1 malic enzyme, NAD binding domain protein [Acinetobacter baumannii 6112]KCY49742.1 malic enzyme, NAD binding domain protein [Acinetobacter baumannii 1571545]KCZ28838.1 malic enzyme, NAD binding domain protein [Acinetobacter baumannii 25977_9]MDQ9824381.1 NADP-dependent malic enzyme [Acinetobacter sp. 163]SSQ38668.1 malic enzyme [Acinetobacter baumannii]
MDDQSLKQAALNYHEYPNPGKISVTPSKQLVNQRDLALAYSPGVAAPCLEIERDPSAAAKYTARGNLVAVVSNGTAVLGLGNIGPLASKPVMEGKGVLFKKFAGVDVFDIEIAENDPDKIVDIVASLEPTFGGINLEDIKAPECFYIEKKLRERMKIPVFHDDQHGTSIIVGSALLNALQIVNKKIEEIKIVASGAGAAALSCLDLLCALGVNKENIIVADSRGLLTTSREGLDESKKRYVQDIKATQLHEVMAGADMFLGLSAAGILTKDMVKQMAENPIIFALANPDPEILPEHAHEVRPDVIMATGRSDYPNQVNNALCFPYIFRGALDVGATTINEDMKIACVHAIARMAHVEADAATYGEKSASFGRDYLIPRPLDQRLILEIAPAVAKAAMDSGVATRPIEDFSAYRQKLSEFVYNSAFLMKPIFAQAKTDPKRIAYAEGEDERVLRAVQIAVDEDLAKPILVGRTAVIEANIKKLGLRLQHGVNIEIVDQEQNPMYEEFWKDYYQTMQRKGITVEYAQREARRRSTLIASLLVKFGKADGMLCGTYSSYNIHLDFVRNVIGLKEGMNNFFTLNALMLEDRNLFIADTYVNTNPTAEQLAEMTILAAEEVRRFGITPRVALLSHSSFGSDQTDSSAQKMREVYRILSEQAPELEVEGEMHGDAALDESIRQYAFPGSRFKGSANLLIMPNLDAANISFNLLKATSGNNVTIGPILLGAAKPVHILTPTATTRRLINMTALTVAEIQQQEK